MLHFCAPNSGPFAPCIVLTCCVLINLVLNKVYVNIFICRPFHFIRFIGTSPFSSNVRSMLGNLCQQVTIDISFKTYQYTNDFAGYKNLL